MFENKEDNFVDAIEEGRIVKVPESYALREGLLILKKYQRPQADSVVVQEHMKISPRLRGDRKIYADLDKYRRPLRNTNEIMASLVDNFHWILASRRKQLNLARKQVANSIGVSEEDLKIIENGVLPRNDYVLISKLEAYYGINLRKDGSNKVQSKIDAGRIRPNFFEREKKDAEDIVSSNLIVDNNDKNE